MLRLFVSVDSVMCRRSHFLPARPTVPLPHAPPSLVAALYTFTSFTCSHWDFARFFPLLLLFIIPTTPKEDTVASMTSCPSTTRTSPSVPPGRCLLSLQSYRVRVLLFCFYLPDTFSASLSSPRPSSVSSTATPSLFL